MSGVTCGEAESESLNRKVCKTLVIAVMRSGFKEKTRGQRGKMSNSLGSDQDGQIRNEDVLEIKTEKPD